MAWSGYCPSGCSQRFWARCCIDVEPDSGYFLFTVSSTIIRQLDIQRSQDERHQLSLAAAVVHHVSGPGKVYNGDFHLSVSRQLGRDRTCAVLGEPSQNLSTTSIRFVTAALRCLSRGCTTAILDSSRSRSSLSIRRASNLPTNYRSKPDTNHLPFSSSSSNNNLCHSRQDQSLHNSSNSCRAKLQPMARSGLPPVLLPANTAASPLSRLSPVNMPPKRSRPGYSQRDFRNSSMAPSQGRRFSNLPHSHSQHSLLRQRDTGETLPLQLERPQESQMVC